MKRFGILLFAMLMTVGLIGCGDKNNDATEPGQASHAPAASSQPETSDDGLTDGVDDAGDAIKDGVDEVEDGVRDITE